jgi:O-antigen/teichoic acid export membrane protein
VLTFARYTSGTVRVSKGFIKNSFIYTVAGALPMASALILVPFYLRYLPGELYGVGMTCLAFSVLVQILASYSFDTSLYVTYHELKHDRDRLSTYVSSAFIFMLLLGVALTVFFALSGEFIFTYFIKDKDLSFYPYGLISVGIGVFQAIFKVHSNLLQTREKSETYLWANVINFTIIAAASIAGMVLFPNTLVGPLGGRLLAGVLMTLWVLFRVFGAYGWHFKSPWQQTSARFNALAFVYQVLQWVINYFDRLMIAAYFTFSMVATYDFAIKCLVPVELMLNGLNSTIGPKVVKRMNEQTVKTATQEINRYYYGLVSVVLLILCLSIAFIPSILALFVKKDSYAGEALQYIPYIAVVFIFRAMRLYFVTPYTVLKKMGTLTVINIFVSALKIGLMVVLITRWQLYGVVVSAVLAYAFELVLLWINLKDDYAMRFNAFKLFIAPLLMFAVIVVGEPLLGVHYPLPVHLGYGVLCVGLLYVAYRNEVKLIDPFKILK